MAKGPSPLLGYNTNVRHGGKLYHIQTEDSGIKRPHIMTHLFADGGRIVASTKTSYAEHVGAPNLGVVVKQMMRDQHKAMFVALRDGVYDKDDEATPPPTDAAAPPTDAAPPPTDAAGDVAALEAAAARLAQNRVQTAAPTDTRANENIGSTTRATASAESAVAVTAPKDEPADVESATTSTRYHTTRPNPFAAGRAKSRPPESIFGGDLLSEKSLDEVILSYLAEDLDDKSG